MKIVEKVAYTSDVFPGKLCHDWETAFYDCFVVSLSKTQERLEQIRRKYAPAKYGNSTNPFPGFPIAMVDDLKGELLGVAKELFDLAQETSKTVYSSPLSRQGQGQEGKNV